MSDLSQRRIKYAWTRHSGGGDGGPDLSAAAMVRGAGWV